MVTGTAQHRWDLTRPHHLHIRVPDTTPHALWAWPSNLHQPAAPPVVLCMLPSCRVGVDPPPPPPLPHKPHSSQDLTGALTWLKLQNLSTTGLRRVEVYSQDLNSQYKASAQAVPAFESWLLHQHFRHQVISWDKSDEIPRNSQSSAVYYLH